LTAGAGGLARYAAAAGAEFKSLVRIEGTSTIHNWQVEGHLIGGTAEFGAGFPERIRGQSAPGPVEARVNAFIPVRSLKSVKSDGSPYSDAMDEIMYGKLLAEEHKRISYSLKSLTVKQRPDPASPIQCEAVGLLGVAGQTNTVTMPATITPGADGKIGFAGSLNLKMTDFNITPPAPTAAGVVIKTGDEVTLKFEWWVKPVAPATAAK
jgi:hypothetical protein